MKSRILVLVKVLVISSLLGGISSGALLWFCSLHSHIPSHWGRVYLSSDCEFSHMAFRVVQSRPEPLAAIPLDVGSLMLPACRHTQELLMQEGYRWQLLRLIPDDLVCTLMIADGSQWYYSNIEDVSWPVFSGRGGTKAGATPDGFAAAGLVITAEELERFRTAALQP